VSPATFYQIGAFADSMHQDAGRTVPTAMIGSYLLSGVLSVIFLVSYLFVIVDIDGAVNHPTGYPFLFVFQNAFSMEAVNVLTAIVICLIFAGTLSYNLSSSRQMWAVSHGLHDYIENVLTLVPVCPRRRASLFQLDRQSGSLAGSPSQCRPLDRRTDHPPVSNQHWLRRCLVSAPQHKLTTHRKIQQLTTTHSNAIISLNLVCLMWTYMISIGCVLYRRIYFPELLPKCQWSLGKWGVAVNAGAFLYSSFAFFWSFWPNEVPVTVENFNWASLMFLATAFIAVIDWCVRGRHVYKGPVVFSEGWKEK
jgi:choline transport protein